MERVLLLMLMSSYFPREKRNAFIILILRIYIMLLLFKIASNMLSKVGLGRSFVGSSVIRLSRVGVLGDVDVFAAGKVKVLPILMMCYSCCCCCRCC